MEANIHIVLATYNGARYIREQLDSVLANGREDLTVEVCDDGSTDGTLDIVREYEKKYDFIHLYENGKNLGFAKNFLAGVKRSRSPYVMLCDQDDIWDSDKISRTLEAMKKLEEKRGNSGESPLLVFTDARNYDSETGEELGTFHQSSHLATAKTDPAHLFMENKCIGCTVMVNAAVRSYLETVPDEVRVHDWWLALICSHFGEISYLAETTLQYRQHRGNMIGGSSFSAYIKNRVANLKKQREVLVQTFAQGAAFYRMFGDKLGERTAAWAFSRMGDAGFWRRRWYTVRYGFWKSGFVRNVALMLLL